MKASKRIWFATGLFGTAAVVVGTFTSPPTSAASFPQPPSPHYTKHVTITYWTWAANTASIVKAFEKAYPTIKVLAPSVGAGQVEYTKLLTALKAGTGAPDDVAIEFDFLPQFINTGGLLDISKYDDYVKKYFLPWTWNQVSEGGKLYAIPHDIGPMAFMYRTDLFNKYHLSPPATWGQFAAEAAKFHRLARDKYFTFFPYTDAGWVTAMLWQAGWRPFEQKGQQWSIHIDSPVAVKVLNYWGNLIKKGYVQPVADFTPQWNHDIGKGEYASMPVAAWGPQYVVQPDVKAGTQEWLLTDIPQWNPTGPKLNGNWGGSTVAVTTQSKHPAAAALFAAWVNSSYQGVSEGINSGLFTADQYSGHLPAFKHTIPLLGHQAPNPVFERNSNWVTTSFEWSPWTSYVFNEMSVEFSKAAKGKEGWEEALKNIQTSVVSFAKTQGYNVSQ